jgi:hypothetical protein
LRGLWKLDLLGVSKLAAFDELLFAGDPPAVGARDVDALAALGVCDAEEAAMLSGSAECALLSYIQDVRSGGSKHDHVRTYVNTVHTLSKFALKLDIFRREFGVYFLVVNFLHLA